MHTQKLESDMAVKLKKTTWELQDIAGIPEISMTTNN